MEKLETLPAGTKVGPFRILYPIREIGGMAALYVAEVRERYRRGDILGRVALKLAKAEYEDFLRTEADILSRLTNHSHIVQVYPLPSTDRLIYWTVDTVKTDDRRSERVCFMAMEYVGGGSLRQWLERQKKLGVFATVGIARQIVDSLARVHANHVVHLDVKPDHVLFRSRRLNWLRSSIPQAVLCDFGIARDLARPRDLVVRAGTEDYMAPELFYNREWNTITCGADIYSLGIVIYEMLTGQLPFDSVVKKLDWGARPRPIQEFNRSASSELTKIVMKALERDPVQRYASAMEMKDALVRVPTGIDGEMVMRQLLAGVGTAGVVISLTLGGMELWRLKDGFNNPTPTVTATRSVPTPTLPPPTPTRTYAASSATPVNTFTPFPTPIPSTGTPSPTVAR